MSTPPPVIVPKQKDAVSRDYFHQQKEALYQLWATQDILLERTPASATDTGVKGTLCRDDTYLYYCTATNTWVRTAIGSLFATW